MQEATCIAPYHPAEWSIMPTQREKAPHVEADPPRGSLKVEAWVALRRTPEGLAMVHVLTVNSTVVFGYDDDLLKRRIAVWTVSEAEEIASVLNRIAVGVGVTDGSF